MTPKILFLLALILTLFPNCTTDYFGFSEDTASNNTAARSLVPMVYCNKFNENGFNGILISYYDWDTEQFNTSKSQLYLWSVPSEFSHPPTNYIQMHSFSIANNKETYNSSPVTIEMTPDSSALSEQNILVTTIGHDLLDDVGGISINELIKTHSFTLEDINGWHGVTLSVFNVHNKPIKTAQVLIPPFAANPHTYLNNNNQEQLLFKLHPFEKIAHIHKSDKVFYNKGLEFCEASPFPLEIPAFNSSSESANTTEDPVDGFTQDLSLLPDL